MKNRPLVSVIVPIYNGEKYIASCLENIIAQTYKNLEIIVVDDGSTDQSSDIANKYPIKLISHDKNRGLSAARNTGIDAAKGDYIHFMDVDDGISNDYYLEMVKAIIETDSDIACGGTYHERNISKSQHFNKVKTYTRYKDKLRATYVGKWGYVWKYLFKTDYLKQNNFRFEEGRFIEDKLFSLPAVYHAKRLVVVPNATYYYYNRENSIMTSRDEEHKAKVMRDTEYAKTFLDDFSKKHRIKIPGVHSGRVVYYLKKKITWLRYKKQNP